MELSDKQFFRECLNLEFPGLEKVKIYADDANYREARVSFCDYVRKALNPDIYFSIPYEEPENIYKLPDESDYDACKRIRKHIMVSVGTACDFGKNGVVDWHSNPTDYNFREWVWQLNRHNELKLLAHEYRRTGESWLAETAAELFSSWVTQTSCPDDCKGNQTECFRTIECGIRMGANWPYALFSFYQSKPFTDDVLVDWYKSVWEQGNRLSKNFTSGNWLIMEMNGLAHIGIIYPMFVQSKQWLTQAFLNMTQEVDRQFYPDGFQYELSTNYHEVALNNYQRMIDCANAFGVSVPEKMLVKITAACELEAKLMMPDGRLPDINDGERLQVLPLLERKKHLFPHNVTIQAVPDAQGKTILPYNSLVLPYSGFLVMRTGWGKNDTWALFDAGPFGHGHQHEDKLSVLLFSGGKLLVTECGNYAYDESPMRKYAVSSAAHNTVVVDGCGQNRRAHYKWDENDIHLLSGLNAEISSNLDFGQGVYTDGYGDSCQIKATHERKVYFCKSPMKGVKPYLIVVDRLSANESHCYEWLWHIDSEYMACGTSKGRVSFDSINVCFSAGNAAVICGQTEPEWQGFLSDGSNVQGKYRKAPCVKVSAYSKNIRMVTVLAPDADDKKKLVKVIADKKKSAKKIALCYEDRQYMVLDEDRMKFTEIDLKRNSVPSEIEDYIYLLEQIMSNFESLECEDLYGYFYREFNRSEFSEIQMADFKNGEEWLHFLAVQKFDYHTMKKLRSRRVIVSLTSYPARIQTVSTVLAGIYSQTLQADEVILWLAEEQFPEKEAELPSELIRNIQDGKLTVRWCDDVKSHKKYFYAMQEYPDDIIVTVDDDLLYPEDTLQKLYDSYLAFPDAVSTIRAHLITVSEDGEILPYRDWLNEMDGLLYMPSMFLMATGCQGVLYPPHLFPAMTYDKQAICETCLFADDLWLKTMEIMNHVPTVCASNYQRLRYVSGTQETALYKSNSYEGGNDTQLKKIIAYFREKGMGNVWENCLSFCAPEANLSSRANICYLTNQRYSDMRRKLNRAERVEAKLKKNIQQNTAERDELNRKLNRAYDMESALNNKLEKVYLEKDEIKEKLRKAILEKSEINEKLQKTYKEKSERGEELKELKSHFLVRVDRKLRNTKWRKK